MARIVFMGTPAFAVPALDALTHTHHDLVGVYTRPDKPAGRGNKIQISPVKQFAQTRGIAIFQPTTLRQPEIIAELRALAPDLILVAAYGLILPPDVLAIPPRGCVNLHASLLPRYRGAAPIAAAILAGDDTTGITLMQMDAGLDTGAILFQRATPITENDTTGTLTTKLAHLAAGLLVETLPRLLAGEITPQPQDPARTTTVKLIRKEAGLIDWTQSALEIARQVRAFNPWPSAYTFWQGTQFKILFAQASEQTTDAAPGRIVALGQDIGVTTGRGVLVLREVQFAGKRAMTIHEFVRGKQAFIGSAVGAPTH